MSCRMLKQWLFLINYTLNKWYCGNNRMAKLKKMEMAAPVLLELFYTITYTACVPLLQVKHYPVFNASKLCTCMYEIKQTFRYMYPNRNYKFKYESSCISKCLKLCNFCVFVQQFKEEVEKGDSQFCLPYKMEKDKIEDPSNGQSFSIK